jgi:Rrf2 family protein
MISVIVKSRRRRARVGETTQFRPLLTQTAEYALRALALLARLPRGESLRAADLAAETGVPPHYLSKVLRRMSVAGILEAQKGHRGGFALARRPRDVQFAEVLEALGAGPDRDRCAFGWGKCSEAEPCPLHPAWSRLVEAFERWTTTSTLADLCE